MEIIKTPIADLLIIKPRVFEDPRGCFCETYNAGRFKELCIDINFCQDNQSKSSKGVFRGLHYQNAPHAQSKLIRVLSGKILDVVLDLRKTELTFGKIYTSELSAENKKQLFVPKGFAHGFAVISE